MYMNYILIKQRAAVYSGVLLGHHLLLQNQHGRHATVKALNHILHRSCEIVFCLFDLLGVGYKTLESIFQVLIG